MAGGDIEKRGQYYSIWDTPLPTIQTFGQMQPEDQLRFLVTCGHSAASTHNTQPASYKIIPPDKIAIYQNKGRYFYNDSQLVDDRRVLPASDKQGRQSIVSIGCAIGSIETAAASLGMDSEVSVLDVKLDDVKPLQVPGTDAETPYHLLVAQVRFSSPLTATTSDEALLNAIFSRRSNRSKFVSDKDLPAEIIDTIGKIGSGSMTSFHFIKRGNPIIRGIAELQSQADGYVANTETFSRELGSRWLVPNDSTSGLGMPGDTFGLSDSLAKRFHLGLKGEIELTSDEIAGFAQMSKEGILSSPLVVVSTTKDNNSVASWLEAGRNVSKAVIYLESQGISTAFHAGLAEVTFVRKSLALALRTNETPVILFRSGYATEFRPHSPRLPLSEVIID